MPDTIPFSISQEASQFIAEMGLQEPFQKLLNQIPVRIPAVHAISVSLQEPYDLGGGPRVIFDVTRERRTKPGQNYDDTEMNWERWVIENFPPEEFEHFCLLSNFGSTNAG